MQTNANMALIAAGATAAITFVNPATHAKAYHQAWQALDSIVRKHQQTPPTASEQDLNDSVDAGEKLISDSGV